MNASTIIFYLLAAFILGTGLLAVTTKMIFRAAIWLLFSLMGIAGLFFWMQVEFLAAVQIVIYVGGIVVLIIFSIFLTQQSGKEMPNPKPPRIIAAAFITLAGLVLACLLIFQNKFQSTSKAFDWSVAQIGTQMMSTSQPGYALPFEVVSILLLAAMIGCIVIAMKKDSSGLRVSGFGSENNSTHQTEPSGGENPPNRSAGETQNFKPETTV